MRNKKIVIPVLLLIILVGGVLFFIMDCKIKKQALYRGC